VDLATTRAQAKGAAPSTSHDGCQIMAAMATPLNVLPPPSTDGVDRLYHQLAEIHAIAIVRLVECTRWHCSDSTSGLVHASAGW
jgi:hypothetical protein